MKTWFLVVDVEKCENCQNCFLACKDEHVGNTWPGYAAPQPDRGPSWIEIRTRERGAYPLIDVAYLPVPCMHCDDAPCIRAARRGEVSRRSDGIVVVDPVRAKGQEHLVAACPYGAMRWNEELQLPQKCTLCAHLVDDGWDKSRCVQSCPTGALTMHRAEAGEIRRIVERERLETYLPGHGTKPRVYYRNLYRFQRCFIGGSVAVRIEDGSEECGEGARIDLLKVGVGRVGDCEADAFGDFKFDGLEEGSGDYVLTIAHGEHTKTIQVALGNSVNLGTICLGEGQGRST